MKKYYLLVVFILFAGFSFAQSKYEEALSLMKEKDYSGAVKIAQVFFKSDSSDQALKILVDVVARDSTNKAAYELLGDVYAKMGVLELAISDYDRAEKLDTTSVPIRFKYAQALEKEKSYTEAANKYLEVITLDSTYSPAYLRVGEILYYAKQYPNAAFYLDKYLKYGQKDIKAYFYAANSLFLIHNFQQASEVAQAGLQNFPQQMELKRILAVSLAFDKKLDEALKYFADIPDSVITAKEFTQIGIELQNEQMDSAAVIFYKKAMNRDTSIIGSLAETVATNYYSAGNYDSAIVYYDKKIKADPGSMSAHVNKALSLIQKATTDTNNKMQLYDNARISLLEAVKLKPDYLPSLEWLGRTYQYMDSTDAAINTYNKLIQTALADPVKNQKALGDAYGSIALVQLIKKKYVPAIEFLRDALKYDADNAQYHLWLAQSLALTKKTEDAVKEYKKVLQLDPKNAEAKKGLKLLGY